MTAPTREVLRELAGAIEELLGRAIEFGEDGRARIEFKGGERRALRRLFGLLDAYPLPAAEGEREELAELLSEHADEVTQQDLDRAAALLRAPAATIRGHWIDTATWVCSDCCYATAREHDLCSKCARPNRPPMIRERAPAGVDLEAAARLVEDALAELLMLSAGPFFTRGNALVAAIRALPEALAKPR